ncbi:bifunctional riboflavin kinase/FAD synthetase [Paenibacillus yanchengensis]|uniref:Riboflavin biosynthesis protein n=1 Tax=Paenibacillus yanchengensis TaxID=2035833 RepID=A0ABW4YPA2_9BACL
MELIEVTTTPAQDQTPITLVIGKFDGVHRGHVQLLQNALQHKQGKLAVMSFSDHPRWILRGEDEYRQHLTPLQHKLVLLESMGVEKFYHINFTKEFSAITAEQFVQQHLAALNVQRLVIGADFRLGKDGSANAETLSKLCGDIGIIVDVIPLLQATTEKISSTSIRHFLKNGQIEAANEQLGRKYAVWGEVIHGNALGRTLGFPTINLGGMAHDYVPPKPGVYIGRVEVTTENNKKEQLPALISAGFRPTVDGKHYLIEGYILNFSGNLYGQQVAIYFEQLVRNELKFENLDDLIAQMELDRQHAEHYFHRVLQ